MFNLGPQYWCQLFPLAAGHKQSPIDINESGVVFDPLLKETKFSFDYHLKDCCEMLNKGTTWSIKLKPAGFSS